MPTTRMSRLLFSLLNYATLFVDGDGGGGGDGGGDNKQTPPSKPTPPETFSREYVQELRHESASYRTKAQEAEKKAQEAEDRAAKALEESTSKVTEAEKKANDRILRSELKAEAIKAGMIDLDGLKLADLSKVTLKEDGTVDGAETLFKELKEAKPYLFGTPNSSSNDKKQPPDSKKPEAKKVSDMTDEEYAEAKKNLLNGK